MKTSETDSTPILLNGDFSEIWGKAKWKNLFLHVDIASLVVFRILYGAIMIWEVYRYVAQDRIFRYYIQPKHHFYYWPFDFVELLQGQGMYILFYIMGGLALLILLGLFYRLAMTLFSFAFLYVFLIESSNYLNHFYLIALFNFILILVPAHRAFSLDALLFAKGKRSQTAPAWSLWMVRFMVGVPYLYGGIAKITPDWLRGAPLTEWLTYASDFPVIGQYFGERWIGLAMSYAGLGLDLFIVPALLWKKTRLIGFILITSFHLMNSQLFSIGIFPWFMIAATSIYFHPSWPRKWWSFFTRSKFSAPTIHQDVPMAAPRFLNRAQKALTAFLAVWIAVQLLLPFRHFAIPGNVHWTEEGHRWAWHMKLRAKMGEGVFTIKDKDSGELMVIEPDHYLNPRQQRKMFGNPYLIWQFSQIIKEDYAEHGFDVEVYANIMASLNGRRYQQLIDPTVDLGAIPGPIIPPSSWIVPLSTPLRE